MSKIRIKTENEIAVMRRVGMIHAEIIEKTREYVVENWSRVKNFSTLDIENFALNLMRERKVQPIQIGYFNYPFAICAGVNSNAVHTIPSHENLINDGDIVTIDTTIKKEGLCIDGGLTIPIGSVDKDGLLLIETAKRALLSAVKASKEGNYVLDISNAVYKIVREKDFEVLRNYVGHGIGEEMHEDPNIPNFPFRGNNPMLKKGVTLALDTQVTEGSYEIDLLDDGWSTKTKDGKRFAFFEYTVLVTEEGGEILNPFSI